MTNGTANAIAHFAGSWQPDSKASSGRSSRMTAQRSVSARSISVSTMPDSCCAGWTLSASTGDDTSTVAITMRVFKFVTPLLRLICGRPPRRAVASLLRLVRGWRGHAKAKRLGSSLQRRMLPRIAGREAGSDGEPERWAVVASPLATAKLNDVEPFTCLKDVLERLSSGHPMGALDDLLPWNWAPSSAAAA
jgi:hypothetical protein